MSPAPRHLLGAGLGWLAGTGWQLQAAALQPQWAVGLGVAALLVGLCSRWGGRRHRFWVSLVVAAVLAWSWTTLRATHRLSDRLAPALEGPVLNLQGSIRGLPSLQPDVTRFDFEVDRAQAPAGVPSRIRLGWYRPLRSSDPAPVVGAGEHWVLTVRLKQVHGVANPAGFDYELHLFEQGIGATGTVSDGQLTAAPGATDAWVSRTREALRASLYRHLGDRPESGILAALTVGDQAAIDRSDWTVFRLTGVAHLVAISGMHVTMFAWLAAGVIGWGWRRAGGASLRWPAPMVARWGGVAAAGCYAIVAGWGLPAQRTVWMLFMAAFLRSRACRWPWPWVLGAAGGVVVVIDPWALLQPGFWLSFVAVAVLMANGAAWAEHGVGGWRDGEAWWRAGGRRLVQGVWTQVLITAALAPLSMVFFQQVSLVGLLANLVAIPLVSFVVTPLALVGAVWPAAWALDARLLDVALRGLRGLAALPWAAWRAPAAPGWVDVLAFVGMVALVLPWPRRVRLLGLTATLPALMHLPQRPPHGDFELLAADIGQGNAVLLRTSAHDVLYDAGPQNGAQSDAGERVLVPLLHALGVPRLDLMVLSHRDSDHVGGAASVVRGVGVHRMQSSLEPGHPLRALAPHQTCEAGQSWHWDGVKFEFLYPDADSLQGNLMRQGPSNARSCVLRVQGRSGAALLTGDIEALQELRLLAQADAASLKADVLLVPHHGSLTSSSAPFVAAVHPTWALVQAGYRNRFNHPVPAVLARYRAAGARVVRTDSCGAWHWSSADGSTWCERHRRSRYWHAAPSDDDSASYATLQTLAWP